MPPCAVGLPYGHDNGSAFYGGCEEAAEAVASEEVSEVLVFGSVARGEAGPDSDIDLVAVYDDLDYSTRWERATQLGRLASAAARRVFVYVTDWPEWTRRAAEVSSSLERAVAGYAVVLHRRPPNGVSWGKEIGKPATDREEAAARLDNARRALFGVAAHLPMGPEERYALEDGDPGYYVFGMRDRTVRPVRRRPDGDGNQPQALIHLDGIRPARTHALGRLLGALPAARGDALRRMFVAITPEEASMWREAAAYEHTDWSLESLVARAYHMARAGAAVSRYAADCFPDTESARLIHKAAARVEAALDGWDLTAEDAFDMTGQPPPPELLP